MNTRRQMMMTLHPAKWLVYTTLLIGLLTPFSQADDMKAYLDSTDGSSSFSVLDQQSNELMRVQSDGLIGMGTNIPSSELEVVGTITATAFSGDGALISNLTEVDPVWTAVSNGMQSQIDSKADQSELASATNALWTTMGTKADQTSLTGKVDQAEFNSATNALWTTMGTKADQTSLTSKVDQADFNSATNALWTTMATKANKTSLTNKVDQADFNSATNALWTTMATKTAQAEFNSATSSLWSAASTEETLRQESDAALSNQVGTLDTTKLDSSTWTDADSTTNYTMRTGDTMTGTLIINAGSADAIIIESAGTNIAIGNATTVSDAGVAIGSEANGNSGGVGVGTLANGNYNAVAIGHTANGQYDGVAVGAVSEAIYEGVAVGKGSLGSYYSVAIGHEAEAMGNFMGESRIAIGYGITNNMEDNSAVMRGTLYLDGGTGLLYRSSIGSGAWMNPFDGLATGTPLYVETDAVWTNAQATGFTMGGTLTIDSGSADAIIIESAGTNIAIGNAATVSDAGVAIGSEANGESGGVAMGTLANGNYNAVAIGHTADGQYDGVAIGAESEAKFEGVAVGKGALGTYYSVAIGHGAKAMGNMSEESRIAIGHAITNELEDNSAVMRGTLYLDGGTGLLYRSSLGSGAWINPFAGLATGTPLYVETDYIWTNAQATGFTMGGTLTINEGSYNMLDIECAGTNISIGNGADSDLSGIAVGYDAEGVYESVAIGHEASAGRSMPPTPGGVAIGYKTDAALNSVAVGRGANAGAFGAVQRIAIGASVTNYVNNSAVIRGTLYLDGATGVLYRSSFGSGAWQRLASADTDISYTVPYEICNSNPSNNWNNNTSSADWQWNEFSVAVNGMDHTADGVIEVKLRIYGESDNGTNFFVGLRNETDTTYALAHTNTDLGSAGWWDSNWATITNAALKEFRVSAYTGNSADYYYIKRATLLVRSTEPLD